MFGFNKTSTAEEQKNDEQLQDSSVDEMPSDQTDINPDIGNMAPPVESNPASSIGSKAGRLFKQAPTQILKPSIISEGFDLVGDIKSSGGLHVEGRINGNIEVDNVTIGAKGTVTGQIKCNALSIKGSFDGGAICDTLNLSGNAIVNGDIQYAMITMAAGTVLTGQLKRK